jgi:hypothetical protein
MAKKLRDKKSMKEFSDRELLEVLFAGQVILHRKLGYVRNILEKKSAGGHGPFENTVHNILKEADEILRQTNEYLSQSSEYKSEIPYPSADPDNEDE